jgi:sulfite exporter TauE/SafE
MRLLRNKTKDESYFTPLFLGAMTVLIPCGITQGMMVMAVASQSAILGAAIMFAFTLGTTPVFAGLGFATSKLMEKKGFVTFASIAIIILGVLSINSGQVLRGSAHTLQNYWAVMTTSPNESNNTVLAQVDESGYQEVTIDVNQRGYTSSVSDLKVNVPVKLRLRTQDVYSCALAFTIPSLKISKVLKPSGEEIIEFTPTRKGRLPYSCSMGMYGGSFNVI